MKKILAVFAILSFAILQGAPFELTKDGRACSILVIPDKAVPSVEFAAKDLSKHIELISGAVLPVLRETAAAGVSGNRIYLGACKACKNIDLGGLSRNGFLLRILGSDSFALIGRDTPGDWQNDSIESGTRMASAWFLDVKLGVRWLWPGDLGTWTPSGKTVSVDVQNMVFRQPLSSSRHAPCPGESGWTNHAEYLKFRKEERVWQHHHGFSWNTLLRNQHSFGKYYERFHGVHPDFFNLLPNGKRESDPFYFEGRPDLISMCVSNPQLIEQVVADWKANRTARDPNIFAGENDTQGKCTCDSCMKLDAPIPGFPIPWEKRGEEVGRRFQTGDPRWADSLGSLTDRYCHFYLEVLKKAKKIDPNVKLIGLSYANYAKAPHREKLNRDIKIAFVGKLMYPWKSEDIEFLKKDFLEWSRTGAFLEFRPNFMLDGHNFPIFFARKFHDLFQFMLKNGMQECYFDSDTGQYSIQGMNLYTLSRMIMRPELSYEEILSEYCGAFGKAAPDIRTYWEFWESVSNSENVMKTSLDPKLMKAIGADYGNYAEFFMSAPRIFTPEIFRKGYSILDSAAAKTMKGTPEYARVDYLRKGLRHAELTMLTELAYESHDSGRFADAVAALDSFRRSMESQNVSSMTWIVSRENNKWDRIGLQIITKEFGEQLRKPLRFIFDPQNCGLAKKWYAADYDDSKWDLTAYGAWETLPAGKKWKTLHGSDYDGFAWYRTKFDVPTLKKGQRAILNFGSVDEACLVWVNGKLVLDRPFPYKNDLNSWNQPFSADITDAVRTGVNVLTVRVEDRSGAGGITRPAALKIASLPVKNNLVKDSGFDHPLGIWKIYRGTKAIRFVNDPDNRINLAAELRIPDGSPNWFGVRQDGLKVRKGCSYRASCRVKSSPDFRPGLILLGVEGIFKKHLTIRGTNGQWVTMELDGITPAADGECGIFFQIGRHAKGSVLVDDVIFTEESKQERK